MKHYKYNDTLSQLLHYDVTTHCCEISGDFIKFSECQVPVRKCKAPC